jgi:MFS family permease
MEKEQKLKEEAKRTSIKEGCAYNVMDGMGVRYITPYALSLGLSNSLIGFLAVFPTLFGNILRISLNKFYYKSERKKIILPFIFLQASLWIPLLLVGAAYFFLGLKLLTASILLIACYSIIVVAGVLVSPAWTSWMQDVVETNRGEYFSKRNRITGFFLLISMLSAGLILDSFKEGNLFFGFVLIFGIAAVGRYLSFYFLKKQYEPKAVKDEKAYFSFFKFIKKMPSNNFGKFVIFVSLTSFAVAIASPFFSVYMLKDLGLSYFAFTLINLSSLISQIIFLPFIGKISDRFGTVRVMKLSGFLIAFVPLFWIFTIYLFKFNSIILISYLFIIELFSGFVWAAFNLAHSNFIYDAVTKPKIILCFTYFSFLNAIGAFFGGVIGGQILNFPSFSLFGLSGILLVFLISFVLRLVPSILIGSRLKEVRSVEKGPIHVSFNIRQPFESFFRLISNSALRPK